MSDMRLRTIQEQDYAEVAELVCISTNYWYQTNAKPRIFPRGPVATRLFCDVYEALDPGCCILAESTETGRLMGSCFYHPRETHVSLGIMNVHPNYFGSGVARRLLQFVVDFAEGQNKPVRLVSSAMNLDSFSLYTRAGFVPRLTYQDMFLAVPAEGFPHRVASSDRVRQAKRQDAKAMADLEMELCHIRREKDYRYFIENEQGIWHVSVLENEQGGLDGFLASVAHPGSNMLGPGVARTQEQAAALLAAELDHNRGRCPVFLIPVECDRLVKQLYDWGARNCEAHFCQVRGAFEPFAGVTMPTFMPETG